MQIEKWELTIQAIVDEMNRQPKEQGKHKVLIGWRMKLEKGPNPMAIHHVDEIVREARRRLPTQQKPLAANVFRVAS